MPTRKLSQDVLSVSNYNTAKDLSGHRLVVVNNTGAVDYASCLDITHQGRIVGLTLNSANAGDRISVQRAGRVIEPSWNWQISRPVWLGVNGFLVQVPPTKGFVLVVGVAIARDSILMANIQSVMSTVLLNV
jgi:hypothetical protein